MHLPRPSGQLRYENKEKHELDTPAHTVGKSNAYIDRQHAEELQSLSLSAQVLTTRGEGNPFFLPHYCWLVPCPLHPSRPGLDTGSKKEDEDENDDIVFSFKSFQGQSLECFILLFSLCVF
jgi:hypothetical protein